jgi:hypothetical protein
VEINKLQHMLFSKFMIKKKLILLILLLSSFVNGQILSEKDRANLKDKILHERFNYLLPELMDQADVDMWIIISREYNEDPVMRTMLPATWLNARRRTILVFYRDKERDTIEKLAIARYDIGKNISSSWNKEEQPDQWKALIQLIEKRNPKNIAINSSKYFAIADGLVQTDYSEFMDVLSNDLKNRVVSAEKLAIAWIETRTVREMELYETLVQITHDIIDEAFSKKVITAGETTTDDVVWWLRQKVTDLGLETWFHPTIDIQRSDEVLKSHIYSFTKGEKDKVILPGDLLHCDFGITYIGLNTDCQQHAYVPIDAKINVPGFLSDAFAKGNALQDIFTANFKEGETGNSILLKSLSEAKKSGLRPSIYTHPLGNYGHSAGTTFGMWDSQEGVPVNGDYPLHLNTVYAIELNTTVYIKEWNKDIRIMLEEAGFYGENGFQYVNNRQKEIKIVQ